MTSISLMDALSAFIFLYLSYLVIRKRNKIFSLDLYKIYIPWISVILISLFANYPDVHWVRSLLGMKWMLLIPIVAWSAKFVDLSSKLDLKNLKYFYLPILFTSGYAILITVLGFDPLRPQRTNLILISGIGGVRTPGFLSNPMTFAHAYGVLLCIFWAYCLYFFNELKSQISKVDFYGLLLTLLLSVTAIFLTFTRGAWLSVGIGLSVITFLYKPKLGKFVVLSVTIFLILTVIFVPTIRSRLSEITNIKESQSDRWHLWHANFKMFIDHPIAGVGYKENFYRLDDYFKKMNLPENAFKSHAHNQFLQQLGGTGIFGLLMYLCFLFIIGKRAFFYWKNTHKNYLKKALGLGILAVVLHIFWGGLFEANFEDSETLHMFCFFLGLFLCLEHDDKVQKGTL